MLAAAAVPIRSRLSVASSGCVPIRRAIADREAREGREWRGVVTLRRHDRPTNALRDRNLNVLRGRALSGPDEARTRTTQCVS